MAEKQNDVKLNAEEAKELKSLLKPKNVAAKPKEKNQDLLIVKDLKKYFPLGKSWLEKNRSYVKAVDGVTFSVAEGKTIGIVGESGCGKTTLGRTILRLYDSTGGVVIYNGIDIRKLSRKELIKLRPKIQIIFQDPYSSLSPRMTIGEIIGEAVREHKIVPKEELQDYIIGVMKSCGLQPYYYSRYPHEFSGGQRQRICVARALALKPDLIVCDEPVSALDVSIQAQIINLLVKLQEEFGITYLFISHDLSVVEYISDEIMVMYLGNVMEHGNRDQVFKNPMHPYTKALLSAIPIPDPELKKTRIILEGDIPSPANPPSGCKFHTRCSQCMDICKTVTPVFKEYEKGHKVACHLYPQE
ncbi:MAG TPA: dipeptide ABC transporter ATP-binding protein [Bacillota bacterium]|nr:dipeptide ABC transporter ATP-binding protein [Bacillota bacterium]